MQVFLAAAFKLLYFFCLSARIDDNQGISYTEFSYQLLQAYDFYWLFEKENCFLQARVLH